ncbi:uncharacterized protein LOC135491220 [Lineus longissimus]|uniref:uncharacterized protein LOC135491220 n=1 Tax=Lineus longissimus TaxID=88925 RepID=UPI002B4E1331
MAQSKPSSNDKGGPVYEDDVCKLTLRGVYDVMLEMGLSMEGLTDLKEAQLVLKTEIIKKEAVRSTDNRNLAAILKKIKEDHKRKCDQLISLLDAIETKIDSVPKTDPLWNQLDIICKDYKDIFENQRTELRKALCKLLVTGETCAGKTSVINNLLGGTFLPESFLCNTQALSEITYGEENHAVAYPWDNGEPLEIVPEEGKDFLEVLKERIEAREDESSHGVFKRIEINLNNVFLKETEVTIIDTPGVGDNAQTTKMVHEHLQDAFGFLFIINTANRGGVHDRICDLANEVTSVKIDKRQFIRPESVVFLGNKFDMIPPSDHDRLVNDILMKLRQCWPEFKSEQFLPYCATEAAAVLKDGFMTRPFCELLNRFETLIPVGSDNKLRLNFFWIANMLRKIIFALDIHINNRQKDLKKKKMELEATIARLSELQEVTVKDFRAFKHSLNKVVDELVAKLKRFFLDERVFASLADWGDADDFSLVTDWEELEKRHYECLASRLDSQMRKWDMEKKEFERAMDKFRQEVEKRVSSIGEKLEKEMRQVSNQGQLNERQSKEAGDTGRGWFRPFLHSMTTFERAFFGYSAVVLFPVTAVIAVSAFIYLGSVKLSDVIRTYFKGHEFKRFEANPVEYLKKRSETLIKEYCNSKQGLRAQVVQMLGPWHEFVDRLTEIVPEQINRDKMMIKTFVIEKKIDAQLNEEYPIRRRSLEAVQKAMRHFEMFSLLRMSKDVAMFSLNEVLLDENEKSKICGGFNADIYRAALRILPAATPDEVRAMIQDGQKMMQANLTSIAEMHEPIAKEEGDDVFPSTLTELEQSFQNSGGKSDVDEMDDGVRHASFSGEGDTSYRTDKVFKAFKMSVNSSEEDGGKVKEVAPCCLQGGDRAEEERKGETGSVDHGGNGQNSVKEIRSCSLGKDKVVMPEDKGAVQGISGATSSGGERKLEEEAEAIEEVGGEAPLADRQPKILSLMNELHQGQGAVAKDVEQNTSHAGQAQRLLGATSNKPKMSSLPANLRNVQDSRIVQSVVNRGQSFDVPASAPGADDIRGCCTRQPISGKMGLISIRCIRMKILERDIYHYLEEERCYSCHQCPNLVKFKGTCISENKVYHKLEPLQCGLRQFVMEKLWDIPIDLSPGGSPPRETKSPKVSVPADVPKYNMIKDWLLSILEGLVYLHAKELTSLNLSLDSIAVDTNNVIKLTNISCPKRIIFFEQLSSMTKDDLRSFRYIALEAFEQNPKKDRCRYTSESDMYAFGLLIWEILCGKVVFEDDFNNKSTDLDTADKFMEFIRTRRPVLPTSELCLSDSDFSNHLMQIQSKCWKFDLNQRITSELCMGLVRTEPRPPPMPAARF